MRTMLTFSIFCLLSVCLFIPSSMVNADEEAHDEQSESGKPGLNMQEDTFNDDFGKMDAGPLHISRVLNIGDGDTAWVIDGAFNNEWKEIINTFYSSQIYPVKHTYMHMNYSRNSLNDTWNYSSSPWILPIDIDLFNDTPIWTNLKSLIEVTLSKQIKLQYGQQEKLRALDAIIPAKSMHCAPNRYVLTLFLNNPWRLNNYGQASFYTLTRNPNITGESRLEITETVHPHAHRAILWPSCHTVLFRPPSVNYFAVMPLVHLWITADAQVENDIIIPSFMTKTAVQEREQFADFTFTNPDANRKIEFQKHLKRSHFDNTKDRPIHVFDDIFTVEELRAIRSHLLQSKGKDSEFDPAPLEDHDNVQWMATYSVDSFMKTDIWHRALDILTFVSNESDWYPYDVALNFVRTNDHTRIHPDAETHQIEYTLLLYLTEGLTPADHGETIWVQKRPGDGVHEFIGDGGNLYEPFAAVAPKFGRLVVFRSECEQPSEEACCQSLLLPKGRYKLMYRLGGVCVIPDSEESKQLLCFSAEPNTLAWSADNIEHSARPPSLQYLGGRYSFAVKVGRNKRLALVKRIYESMEGVEMSEILQRVNRELQGGLHDDPAVSPLTDKHLMKLYKKAQAMSDEKEKKVINNLLEGLRKSSL